MSIDLAHLGRLVQRSMQRLAQRAVQYVLVLAAGTIVLSMVLAPEVDASIWDWLRIILITALSTVGALVFASSQDHEHPVSDRQQHILIATAVIVLALILNLTFSLATTLIYSTVLSVLGLMLANDRGLKNSRTIGALLVGAIPLWIWSALDAWTAGLLLLIPLGVIAVISDGHMRQAAMPAADRRQLSRRGHRLAAWVGILGSALLIVLVSAIADAGFGVATLGAFGALALVAIEATSARAKLGSWHASSVTLTDAALFWIALSWIVSL
jgi:hypothetical protein